MDLSKLPNKHKRIYPKELNRLALLRGVFADYGKGKPEITKEKMDQLREEFYTLRERCVANSYKKYSSHS